MKIPSDDDLNRPFWGWPQDGGAPFAGHLPARANLTYFVAHPCHPSIFNPEVHTAGAPDYFGSHRASQSIVSTLMQGPDEAFALGGRSPERFTNRSHARIA